MGFVIAVPTLTAYISFWPVGHGCTEEIRWTVVLNEGTYEPAGTRMGSEKEWKQMRWWKGDAAHFTRLLA